jgi:hypothetical protein
MVRMSCIVYVKKRRGPCFICVACRVGRRVAGRSSSWPAAHHHHLPCLSAQLDSEDSQSKKCQKTPPNHTYSPHTHTTHAQAFFRKLTTSPGGLGQPLVPLNRWSLALSAAHTPHFVPQSHRHTPHHRQHKLYKHHHHHDSGMDHFAAVPSRPLSPSWFT